MKKIRYSIWTFWSSLAINLCLAGMVMNQLAVVNNGMHMPVYVGSEFSLVNSSTTDPGFTRHTLYKNYEDYAKTNYFIFGDYIHFSRQNRDWWVSIGDIYIFMGALSYVLIHIARIANGFYLMYKKTNRRKTRARKARHV